tara:strand:+ start:2678 stop:2890 length:213 start_codon:yes stop_codon:yes gene_type:complete
MSIESLNRTSAITETYPDEFSKGLDKSKKKVNIEVLKKRIFLEKKRERFQNRVLMGMFCLSLALLGYIIV